MICCKYLHGKWKSDDDATFAHLIHHDSDVMMGTMASQITSLIIVYSTVYSGSDQRKHQSSASLAIVRGIHRWPVNSPHKRPVTRKMFPFDDVIMMNVTVNMIISGPGNGLASDRPWYSQLTDLMSMELLEKLSNQIWTRILKNDIESAIDNTIHWMSTISRSLAVLNHIY